MKSIHKCLVYGLVLLGLSVPAVQAQHLIETFVEEVGEAGGTVTPVSFLWFPQPGTSASTLLWADSKQLEFGPGALRFFIDDLTSSLAAAPYFGALLDAGLNPIAGTEFSGVANADAAKVDLAETTRWSAVFVTLGNPGDGQGLVFTWFSNPTVREGEAAGNTPPVAKVQGPLQVAAGVAFNLDGSQSEDPDGTIEQYDWEFGDGTRAIDAGPQPVHTYAEASTYNVTLTVIDNDGAANSDTTTATVGEDNAPPVAEAGGVGSGTGRYTGTAGVPLQFDGSGSSDDVGIELYDWDFGIQEASGESANGTGVMPQYTYPEPGQYTVELRVEDAEGEDALDWALAQISEGNLPPEADAGPPVTAATGVTVSFDGSSSRDPDGSIAQYDWDFGDNTRATDAGPTPDHVYTEASSYNVNLQVTDDDGLSSSDSTSASIGTLSQAPTADANGPYTGSEVAVTFDGTASSDPDGSIVRYDWNFGDDNTATDAGPTPTHTYALTGRYLVTLTVTDDTGETGTDITIATVGTGNLPPVADAGASVAGTTGAAIAFDGSASSDPDGSIAQYDWNFGDSDSAIDAGPNPDHVYNTPSDYSVTLTVTDNDGARSSDVTLATVSGDPTGGGTAVGGTVQGINNGFITCINNESFQTVPGTLMSNAWDCVEMGLELQAGETVTMALLGFATGEPVKGTVFGIEPNQLNCLNLKSGDAIRQELSPLDWDCTAAGFTASLGDLLRIQLVGDALEGSGQLP